MRVRQPNIDLYVVLDFQSRGCIIIRKRRLQVEPKIKWWKFQGGNQHKIVDTMATTDIWSCSMKLDIDSLWAKMEHSIKEVFGESKGSMPPSKDTSWWTKKCNNTTTKVA